MHIRPERPGDAETIRALTDATFKGVAHSDQTEAGIVDALRAAGALTLSLVAIQDDETVGHVAFSPIEIHGVNGDWHGLGPVSVWPARQGKGVGQALIREGLQRLKALASAGCVVLGDPDYYGRFGFAHDPDLVYGDAPAGYVQRLILGGVAPKGDVTYHPAFGVA